MKTILTVFILAVFAATSCTRAFGHELHHTVTHGTAVIIELAHSDHMTFSFESYEIFRENEDTPFQVGKTDSLGRIVFLPDRSGVWRVRVFSEDGHGLDFTVDVDAERLAVQTVGAPPGQLSKIIVGVAVLFGIFGLISMGYKRRRT